MRELRPAVAWSLAGTTVAFAALQTAVLVASDVPLISAAALDQAYPIVPIALVVGAVVGALIVQRHPAHRIGWLLCAGQAGSAFGLAVQSVAFGVLGGSLALDPRIGHLAAWLSRFFGGSYALLLLGCLLLLVPDGRLPSRRWRWVLVLLAGRVPRGRRRSALRAAEPRSAADGFTSADPVVAALVVGGSIAIIVGVVGAAAALVVRLRRARSVQRQQLRWIATAAALLAAALLLLGAGEPAPRRVGPGRRCSPSCCSTWGTSRFRSRSVSPCCATGCTRST